MAQNKYDLLLVPTTANKTVRPQPWYKERLNTKYMKLRKPNDPSLNLIGKNWVFVKSGIDDFRDGRPCDVGDGYIMQGDKGISPVISHSKQSLSSNTSRVKPRLTKVQQIYSKSLPLQEDRRNYIDEMEYGLTQHPLAVFPHLEEAVPPELFQDVVNILDPDMNPETESEAASIITGTSLARDPEADNDEKSDTIEKPTVSFHVADVQPQKSSNPYKWILQKNSTQRDDKRGTKKRPTSPSQDEHIKKVTKDFCDWVASLGGDSNNVEESTIMSLFASGYETKPALSVPIHVVELTNVPMELKLSAGLSTRGSGKKSTPSSAVTTAPTLGIDAQNQTYTPSWVKVNYGAWYLDPKTWRPREEGEPLEDPEVVRKKEQSESKKKSDEMDTQLSDLHGAKAFRSFLEKTNCRKPKFMVRVASLQDEADGINSSPADDKIAPQWGPSFSRNSGRNSGMTNRSAFSSFR